MDADGQRLRGAHRQSTDRAVIAVLPYAVLGFDQRLYSRNQLLLDSGGIVRRGWSARRSDFPRHVTVGHHDDHCSGFTLGDEVVQNYIGASGPRPRCLDLAVAMEQVQHRIPLAAGFVTGRRVDAKHALRIQVGRVVEVDVNRPVGHFPILHDAVACVGDDERSGGSPPAQLEVRIGRVGHPQAAVDGISIHLQKPGASGPTVRLQTPLSCFCSGIGFLITSRMPGEPIRMSSLARPGSEQSERDLAVGVHLGRDGYIVRVFVIECRTPLAESGAASQATQSRGE